MVAKAYGAAVIGISSYIITVEADISPGLPHFGIVGLPDSSVRESRERVTSAIKNTGQNLSGNKITINLAPGDFKKAGALFDLPVAVAVLGAAEKIPLPPPDYMFAGELSLDGGINPVKGVLPIVFEAKKAGFKGCFVPAGNAGEAASVEGINVYPAQTLGNIIEHLSGKKPIDPMRPGAYHKAAARNTLDYADVTGQELVKRAFALAAAGRHNILITGPPGVGKTMLASRLPSIMPPMTFDESVETTKIFSVRGFAEREIPFITERPFRSVHHTISRVALVGGGNPISPGEISMAHNGVLFLDELAEFPRSVLESLRQPMEERKIVISRAAESSVMFPADFMLIAASNPCPCGSLGTEKCFCSDTDISKYMSKISKPLLDRIDIQAELQPVEYEDLSGGASPLNSETLAVNVLCALEAQHKRFKDEKILFNSQMGVQLLKKYCALGEKENKILESAYNGLSLSARAYHRILKLARTIADFERSEKIESRHLVEAISYRSTEWKKWGK